MSPQSFLQESRPSARIIPWPSIAVASAELRRRRYLSAVPARGESPAVLARVAPPPPIPIRGKRR